MRVTTLIKYLSVICCLAVLAACASNEPSEKGAQDTFVDSPYLNNRAKVSAEVQARFEQANQALEQQHWEAAEADLNWLMLNAPELSGPYLSMALLYKQSSRPEIAGDYFAQAIAVNPNNIEAYNQYGIFLREQGSFQQAEDIYLQALSVWEYSADTHRNLGVLYDLYLGDQKSALRHYYRYQELTNGSDRLVAAWIVDLERQLTSVAKGG